ncbi:MAG: DNA topoisomerase, partial [Acidobacteriota bacterium]
MNLTRAVTLVHRRDDELLSVGRVQTPTLAMLAEREREIRAFVPEPYLELEAIFAVEGGSSPAGAGDTTSYKGLYFKGDKPTPESKRLPADGAEAEAILERIAGRPGRVESMRSEKKRMPSPRLYDLTELQRHANRLFGWSAKRTLEIAQRLYEQKKLISYPRTDSRHLSTDVSRTIPKIVDAVRGPYEERLAPGTGEPLGRRFVDDQRVGDHHAIIPTGVDPSSKTLDADEAKLFDLIARRLLMSWHGDYVTQSTHVVTAVESPGGDAESGEPVVDRFASRGLQVLEDGWKVLDPPLPRRGARKPAKKPEEPKLPSALRQDLDVRVDAARTLEKTTKPPKRFTEATLLTAMETAGRSLDDKELSQAMKDSGLGTPATRASIIETLIDRGYIERQKKSLHVTDLGLRLVDVVPDEVKSPALTGSWEARLASMARGHAELGGFMGDIEDFVRAQVASILGPRGGPSTSADDAAPGLPDVGGPADGVAAEPEWMRGAPASGGPVADAPAWLDAGPPPGAYGGGPDDDGGRSFGGSGNGRPSDGGPSDSGASSSRASYGDSGGGTVPRAPAGPPRPVRTAREPTAPEDLEDLLREAFGYDGFRPYQEAA